jgi:hypothetical protein
MAGSVLFFDIPYSIAGNAHLVAANGYQGVIRYMADTKNFPEKASTQAEVDDLHTMGLKIAHCWELGDTLDYFTEDQGKSDATTASEHLTNLGAPSDPDLVNCTGAFAAYDFDPSEDDIRNVIVPYATQFHTLMCAAGYLSGAYGSGLTLTILRDLGLVHWCWLDQSPGHSGNATFENADIRQLLSVANGFPGSDEDEVLNLGSWAW